MGLGSSSPGSAYGYRYGYTVIIPVHVKINIYANVYPFHSIPRIYISQTFLNLTNFIEKSNNIYDKMCIL